MLDCEIKFVNKEITPYGGLPSFSRYSKNAISPNILNRAVFLFRVPTGVISRFCSYWNCLQVFGAVQAVSDILTWFVMTLRSATCWAGNMELTTGLTSVISTSSHTPSTSVRSANCSVGSFRSCCLTTTLWTLIRL